MRIKRKCKICGKDFVAIKVTQFFCSRKCFKKDYYLRTKSRLSEQEHNPSYPTKKCCFCSEVSKLTFDPIKFPKLFDDWGCPFCGTTNKLVWENFDNPNSRQIISQIIVSFKYSSSTIMQQPAAQTYRTYQLPIGGLERKDTPIIIMPCERMSIFDIQKKNRKRILFS